MSLRFDITRETPDLFNAVLKLNAAVEGSGLDSSLLHLVKLRASQINGCAYCVQMHTEEALNDHVPVHKLHLLPVWREAPGFSERERAALAWTESLTRVAETNVPDSAFDAVRQVFSKKEISELTVAIGLINIWNRIAVSARTEHKRNLLAA